MARKRSFINAIAAAAATVSLAACAGSGAVPSMLSVEQKKVLHLTGVTAEAGRFVMMEKEVLDRIAARVRDEIATQAPNVFVSAAPDAPALTMKLVFTQYRSGGFASRSARSNVGLIQIEADVLFVDANGEIVAASKVATHFGSGGDVGLSTNVLNVEYDFENAVVRLIR